MCSCKNIRAPRVPTRFGSLGSLGPPFPGNRGSFFFFKGLHITYVFACVCLCVSVEITWGQSRKTS